MSAYFHYLISIVSHKITYIRKYPYPYGSAECGIETELAEMHPPESGREGNIVSYTKDEPSYECADSPVFQEKFLALFKMSL